MNFSQRTLLGSLLVVLGLFGGALVYFTMQFLSSGPQAGGPSGPESFQQMGMLFLIVTMMAGLPTVGMGAYVMYIGTRIRTTGQWPPSGMGFRSKCPVILGARASLVGLGTMGFGGILTIVGLFLPLLGWRFFGE